jgi:type II secretory ATPase GspE/PulE/Tfp pilus assembly ATPase PilB-like protein
LKELEMRARHTGMTPLIEDTFEKVRRGETSLQEAVRIAYE